MSVKKPRARWDGLLWTQGWEAARSKDHVLDLVVENRYFAIIETSNKTFLHKTGKS